MEVERGDQGRNEGKTPSLQFRPLVEVAFLRRGALMKSSEGSGGYRDDPILSVS